MRYSCALVAEASVYARHGLKALMSCGIEVPYVWASQPNLYKFDNWERIKLLLGLDSRRLKAAQIAAHMGVNVLKADRETLPAVFAESESIDLIVVFGSEIIFPQSFIDTCPVPIVNFHPALLPHYRGPRPLHALVLNGDADRYGGFTAHILTGEIDAGPIIKQIPLALSDYPDVICWEEAILGSSEGLIREGVIPFLEGSLSPSYQDEDEASYFASSQVPDAITHSMSFREVENFLQKAPQIYANTRLRYADTLGRTKTVRLMGTARHLGGPTQAKPKVTRSYIEMDLKDARVRLSFSHWSHRMRIKLRRLLVRLSHRLRPVDP